MKSEVFMDIYLFLTFPGNDHRRVNIGQYDKMPIPNRGQKIIYLHQSFDVNQVDIDYTNKEINIYAS